jgi:hypothetical protein
MANLFYSKGLEGFADGSIDWDTHDIRVVLCTSAYTRNLTTDDNLDDVPAGSRVVVSGSLTGKTATDGILDAADVTFAALSGSAVTQLVIYKHTGTESTSRLILNCNAGDGFPLTPTGSDVNLIWSDGANKIAAL